VREINEQGAVPVAEIDPGSPRPLQDLLLALGDRGLGIEIDGDDVSLLAPLVAPGEIELGLGLIWRQLK
jgi:hypothetical protein